MIVAVLSTLVSLVISPSLIVLAFLQSQWVATTTLFGKISSIDFAKKPSVEVSEKREREREREGRVRIVVIVVSYLHGKGCYVS